MRRKATDAQELTKALNGDQKTQEPSPLFRINAVLDNSKMDFNPTTGQLKDLLQVWAPNQPRIQAY